MPLIFRSGHPTPYWNMVRIDMKRRSSDYYRCKNLRSKFGLTVEDYDRLLAKQKGRCAICGQHPPKTRRLAVDHIHGTRRVRGLLCTHCNVALGLLGEDVHRIVRMLDYLRGYYWKW